MNDLHEALNALQQRLEVLPDNPHAEEIAPLENEARELLAQSKNTAYENEARELFTRIARLTTPGQSTLSIENAQVRGLLRRARIRIEIAGDNQDFDEAIDILSQALDLAPENKEVHELLIQASNRTPQHQMKVRGLMSRYGINLPMGASTSMLPTMPPPASSVATTPPAFSSDLTEPMRGNIGSGMSDAEALLSEIATAYYAGDYNRTIEQANHLLVRDPNNAQAAEYRQKASDNLMRGVVPDHRIPFDARVAYNRANSLVRAGNYDEAQRLYREARDIAERAGIRSWKDVEQALLEIQDLALAREYLLDGDRLLAADDWSGAKSKYEGSLKIVPNDPEVEERLVLVKKVQEQYEQANVQLSMLSGTLPQHAETLKKLFNSLSSTRQILPGSEKLQQTVFETKSRIQQVKSQLIAQGETMLNRLNSVTNSEERSRLAEQAGYFLQLAVDLDPADSKTLATLQEANRLYGDLLGSRQTMEQAAALIARNNESELAQARQILVGLQSQAQDPRYRTLVDDLMNRYMERMAEAVDRSDSKNAERWLVILKDEPFRILGRRSELLRLEDELRGLKQGRMIRLGVISGMVLLIAVAALFFSQGLWYESVFPPDPTSTITPTASNTPPASNTPTATATATATYTATLEPNVQTATAGVTETIRAATALFVQISTSEALTQEAVFRATVFANDRTATVAAQATNVQATNVVRTEVAQATVNYVNTLTATFAPATFTPSPTSTASPTLTPTVSPILCRITVTGQDVNMRSEATRASTLIRQMKSNEEGDVIEVKRDISGATDSETGEIYIWYRVRVQVGGAEVTGWVRSDVVFDFPECPAPTQ